MDNERGEREKKNRQASVERKLGDSVLQVKLNQCASVKVENIVYIHSY